MHKGLPGEGLTKWHLVAFRSALAKCRPKSNSLGSSTVALCCVSFPPTASSFPVSFNYPKSPISDEQQVPVRFISLERPLETLLLYFEYVQLMYCQTSNVFLRCSALSSQRNFFNFKMELRIMSPILIRF